MADIGHMYTYTKRTILSHLNNQKGNVDTKVEVCEVLEDIIGFPVSTDGPMSPISGSALFYNRSKL